jgi:hypothetical protein
MIFRASSVAEDAAPELLEVTAVRDAVRGEFTRALEAAYAPVPVPADVLAVASERMVQNGYVIDAFADALGDGHRRWLSGQPLAVAIPDRVVSEAAVTALRDADLDFAELHPPPAQIPTDAIVWPWQVQSSTVLVWQRLAVLAGMTGIALAVVGAVRDPRRTRSLRYLAVAGMATGVALALAAFVLPLTALRSVDELGIVGALLGAQQFWWVLSGLLLAAGGLAVHHRAALVVVTIRQSLQSKTPAAKEAAPAASGARPLPSRPSRRRAQALDAFFEATEPTHLASESATAPDRSGPPDVIVLDGAAEAMPASADHAETPIGDVVEPVEAAIGDADEPDSEPDVDAEEPNRSPQPAGQGSPEDERAAALAADRLQALARIDGRQSRNRTYLRR